MIRRPGGQRLFILRSISILRNNQPFDYDRCTDDFCRPRYSGEECLQRLVNGHFLLFDRGEFP